MDRTAKAAEARYGEHLRWHCECGDIANMYTELAHASIDAAVTWGLTATTPTSRQTRSGVVSVSRYGREVREGIAYSREFVQLTRKQIEQIAAFDNANMFVMIKGKVHRQRHGAPMGSNMAPGKAQLTCAQAEVSRLKERERLGIIAVEGRFMDDVFIAVAYSSQ